jgi:RNA polymerase sigma-70 factor (ECF subfamily)
MDPEHLDTLVAAARAGGDWAFERLWLDLSPRVAGYLRGRGVPDPEDVTSEVFLAAFQKVGAFDGDGAAFRSWLFTVAHHKAVDVLRRSGRGPGTEPYDPVDDPRQAASAEWHALAAIEDDEIRALLATLSPDQTDVMLLRVLGGLTLPEVARATGRSLGAVKQLQRRAVAQLGRRLAEVREETSVHPVPPETPLTIASSR